MDRNTIVVPELRSISAGWLIDMVCLKAIYDSDPGEDALEEFSLYAGYVIADFTGDTMVDETVVVSHGPLDTQIMSLEVYRRAGE